MLGSSASVSDANIVLNTAVAEELKQFADTLEGVSDFESALHDLIKRTIIEHKRIIFNGNGYDDAWVKEAQRRGLLNLPTTPDCMPHLLDEKNIKLFSDHRVYSEVELTSRYEINLENYCKILNIEALTMIDMAKKDILPAVSGYIHELADTALSKKSFIASADCSYEQALVEKLSELCGSSFKNIKALENALSSAADIHDTYALAMYYKDNVLTAMNTLRAGVDELESMTDARVWPYPSYGELLFSVK